MRHSTKRNQAKKQPAAAASAAAGRSEVLGPKVSDPARAKHIDPRWAGHYRALLRLRERLVAARGGQLAGIADPLERHSMSPADSASDEFDHDMLLSELSAGQDLLFEVDAALNRIEGNRYGVCELTGRPIGRERLRALPWARFTRETEQELEAQGEVSRAHYGKLQSVRFAAPTAAAEAEIEPGKPEPAAVDLEPGTHRVRGANEAGGVLHQMEER